MANKMTPLEIAYLPRLKLYKPLGELLHANTNIEKSTLPFAYKIWLYIKRSFKDRDKYMSFSQHLAFIQQLDILQLMLKEDNLHNIILNSNSEQERTLRTIYLHDKIIIQNYIKQRENEHKFYMENKETYFSPTEKKDTPQKAKNNPEAQALTILQEAKLAEPKDSIRFLCYSKKEHLSEALDNINIKFSESNIPFRLDLLQNDLVERIEFLVKHTSILSTPKKD